MGVLNQHREWRGDVGSVVAYIEAHFPEAECVTYLGHPWPGWDGRSFDVWADASTWRPLNRFTLYRIRRRLMRLQWGPYIRHTILGHTLWTSYGGYSRWQADDHRGKKRHLHVTYW